MADETPTGGTSPESHIPDHHLRASLSEADAAGLLEIVKAKHARDASIFTEREPYFWEALISNTNRDSYFTRMMPSTLQNFAADAEAGVSFQNSHNTFEQPLGRSIAGKYIGPGGNGLARVTASFYTLRGLKLNSLAVDEFIDGVRSGVISDVSVGFYGGEYRCTICNRDMRSDWDCWHWPGMEYELEDKEGKPTGVRQVAEAKIENARLAEVSAVYDGACPGAFITKAEREISAGRMKPETVRFLTAQYRMQLPQATPLQLIPSVFTSSNSLPALYPQAELVRTVVDARTSREEGSMPDEKGQAAPLTVEPSGDVQVLHANWRAIESAFSDVGLPVTAERPPQATLIRQMGAELTELRPLKDKVATQETRIKELEPQAADGVAFRTDLRAAVEAEYVRALGARAKVELKAEVWDRASIALLKAEYEEYAGQAYRVLGGGRTSVDEGEPHPNGDGTHHFVVPAAPSAAFRA